MMENTSVNLDALERTAAWVQQVSQMKNQTIEEEPQTTENGTDDQESMEPLSQFHNIYQQLQDQFNTTSGTEVDIPKTVKEFKDVLEKFGISQRFAAKNIMEKTSQGNLSFLLDKGRNKQWHELSPRGRVPYVRMRRWLDSTDEQKLTISLLQKTKEYKKTGPKDGGGRREKFSVFQLMVLCRFFEEDPNPNLSTRALLAEKLGAPVDRITIWFQNQRARGFPAKKMLSQSNFSRKPPGAMDTVTSSTNRNDVMRHPPNFLSNPLTPFNLSNHLLQSATHLPQNGHGQNTASLSLSDQSDSFRAQTIPMAAHLNNQSYFSRQLPAHLPGHCQSQSQGHIPDSTVSETTVKTSNFPSKEIKSEFPMECRTRNQSCDQDDQPLNFCTNNTGP